MAPSTHALGTALEATVTCLSLMAGVAQLAPVPYAQQLISLAASILNAIQQIQENKAGFKQLAQDAGDLVFAVVSEIDSRTPSVEMKQKLDELISLLKNIRDFASEHVSRNVLIRAVTNKADGKKIKDYRAKIRHALDVFGLKAHISVHENIVQILKLLQDLQNRRAVEPPAPQTHVTNMGASFGNLVKIARQPSLEGVFIPPPPQATPPLAVAEASPAPQMIINNMDNSFGNLVNCRIGGTVNTMNVNGDYNAENWFCGDTRGWGGHTVTSSKSITLLS
ncbi:hypothetical protein DFH07DRAFT_793565 [Mycena maculata]|uniref:NACHT-NTPase and P-loop NTPases N-terminal domain-containing protein n=1 Tax=Mycena maculata TaxID=230809 RepID=A0AAD7KA19_9AGAR|nr:hypothetical protein DFH07DRAFT_793565 [Mycena maculata]